MKNPLNRKFSSTVGSEIAGCVQQIKNLVEYLRNNETSNHQLERIYTEAARLKIPRDVRADSVNRLDIQADLRDYRMDGDFGPLIMTGGQLYRYYAGQHLAFKFTPGALMAYKRKLNAIKARPQNLYKFRHTAGAFSDIVIFDSDLDTIEPARPQDLVHVLHNVVRDLDSCCKPSFLD